MDARHAHEIHPEDYYMSREVLVEPKDEPSYYETLWDVEVQVETGYPAGTAVLTRRCKWITQPAQGNPEDPDYVEEEYVHGYQRIEASPDTVAVRAGAELHLIDWIYQTWVHGEIWNETFQYWERPLPVTKKAHVLYDPDDTEKVIGVEYIADYGGGNYLKTIVNYNWFTSFPNKYTYELYWPGAKKRVYTQTQVYNEDHFNLDLSDFDGPYDLTPSAGLINITYYPDGVTEDYCIVDPYLGVDEQADYIDVTCDGYILRVRGPGPVSGALWEIYDNDGVTSRFISNSRLRQGGSNFYLVYDHNMTLEIIENTPTRVVLRQQGRYDAAAGVSQNYIKNGSAGDAESVTWFYYIYPDRMFMDFEWITSDTVVLDNSTSNTLIGNYDHQILTNPANIAENSGVEETGISRSARDLAKYVGGTADEINMIFTTIENIGDNGIWTQRFWDDDFEVFLTYNNGVLQAERHHLVVSVVIDSIDREGAAKIYDSTDRLAMGEQYKDPILDQAPSKGDDVTDMIIPARIASGTLHSDGAHFYEPDIDAAVKIALDRTRIRPSFVIQDFPFQSGLLSAPVDHLLAHWKMDDNLATTAVVSEKDNANWEGSFEGGKNTADASDTDAVRGRSLLTGGSPDFILLPLYNSITWKDKFSILIRFKPNFSYDVGSNTRIFGFGSGGFDQLALIYFQNFDRFYIQVRIGGGSSDHLITDPFTSDGEFQRWHKLLISLDLANNLLIAIFNNEITRIITTNSAWTSDPDRFRLGRDLQNSYGPNFFDEVKLFNDCILPYGGYFTDEQNDFANPHADITAFVKGDEANNDSLKIGTGNITITGATKTEDVRGQANSAFLFDADNEYVSIDTANYNAAKCVMGFWFKSNTTTPPGLAIFMSDYLGGLDHIMFARSFGNTSLRLTINGDVAGFSGVTNVWDLMWHYIKVAWDADIDERKLFIDNILQGVNTTAFTAPTKGTNLNIGGSDVYTSSFAAGAICEFTITDDPNTPEIWTAFGKPLHVPLVDKT